MRRKFIFSRGSESMESLKKLMDEIKFLVEFEKKHPDFLYTPLLEYITKWLAYPENEKLSSMPILHKILVDSQDCDHRGTPWEKEWLENGKVCKCPACNTARESIFIIENINVN